jgi:NAD(P)-dependent dehydrogenase (short-subunit alcohol dehydrogenase family)
MRLQDKVALITGAGRGIGRAIAERFAAEGARLIVAEMDEATGADCAAMLRSRTAEAVFVQTDIAAAAQCEAAVAAALHHYGRLDILVNNAAISHLVDFVEGDVALWDQHIQVNLMGAVYCARAAARVMPAGSCIINISSVHGTRGEPLVSAYDVAKGGLDQLTRTLAIQLAERGIRVNAIAPGFINAPMARVDGESELETEYFREYYVRRRKIPMARAGEPEEVAAVAVFLASEDSSYVNGHILVVDGGISVTF